MAVVAGFLRDTSAAARMRRAAVADRLEPLITGGLVAICAGLDAEALSAPGARAEYEQVRADRREAYEYLPTDDGHWQRAFDGATIMHYDADFEAAAEVLEFEHRWVLPRGTV